jgi:hypothetical protein
MQKLVLLLTVFFFVFTSCNRQETTSKIDTGVVNNPISAEETSEEKIAAMVFDTPAHNFGEVIEGEKVAYSFRFTNTGNTELVIANAYAECGCTIPHYSREPIKPGKTGVIDVAYDSKNRPGEFSKKVTVVANTLPNSHTLTISGTVVK